MGRKQIMSPQRKSVQRSEKYVVMESAPLAKGESVSSWVVFFLLVIMSPPVSLMGVVYCGRGYILVLVVYMDGSSGHPFAVFRNSWLRAQREKTPVNTPLYT